MRIIISGTPGTGKSAIAKELSEKMGIDLIDVKKIIKEKRLLNRKHEVDLGRLGKALSFLARKRSFIAENHLLCEVKLPSDHVIILRTDPKVLKKRLSARGYSDKKIKENIMAEMLDYCSVNAERTYGKRPLELDTTGRSVHSAVMTIIKAIKHRKKKLDSVDYSASLKAQLGL